MDSSVRDIATFIRFSSFIVGGICLVVGLSWWIKSINSQKKAILLKKHCDKLNYDIHLLSTRKWEN